MFDVDWITLGFGVGCALLAGISSYMLFRGRTGAREEATERELDRVWDELHAIRQRCDRCPGAYLKDTKPHP